MVVVCSLIWISSDAKEKSSERVDLPIPGHKDGRYRLSGAFLFVNWDSFQISSYPELTTMTVGELFRKAHAFFQGSEFRGSITVKLPNDETYTVFDTKGNFEYFEFASVRYFSVDYTGPSAKNVEIACDLTEQDVTSKDDIVCSGAYSYRVRRESTAHLVSTLKNQGSVDMLALVKLFISRLGYHKLYGPYGAKNMSEVIDELLEFTQKYPDISGADCISLIEDILGIFVVGLTLEEIKDPGTPEDYKRVDDAWSISAKGLGGNELYGQLYLLPQAEIFKVCAVMESLGITCPETVKDLEFPLIQGPAFPLFDLSRAESSKIDFSISSDVKYPISAYYNNKKEHSYVIFSNLWETDGESALSFDDCLAKGNALGFDLIDWSASSKQKLSDCCFHANMGISLTKEGDVIKDQETGLVEYQLTGVFDFICDDDGGTGAYEPYGTFSVSIGNRDVNQKFQVWHCEANDISLNIHTNYRQPFMIRFQESKNFLNNVNSKITLHGRVKEDDDINDDIIGNFDGKSYQASELRESKQLTFEEDSDDKVTITLQLGPVIGDEEPPSLINYVLTVNFKFSCDDDGWTEQYYEPYGSFSIDIGERPLNQEKLIWQWYRKDSGSHEIRIGKSYEHETVTIDFMEEEGFMFSESAINGKVILHGKVMEADGSQSADDVIGNFDGKSIEAWTLTESKTYTFPHDSEDRVKITLQITKETSASKLSGRKIYSDTEDEFARRLLAPIFPLIEEPGSDQGATSVSGDEL